MNKKVILIVCIVLLLICSVFCVVLLLRNNSSESVTDNVDIQSTEFVDDAGGGDTQFAVDDNPKFVNWDEFCAAIPNDLLHTFNASVPADLMEVFTDLEFKTYDTDTKMIKADCDSQQQHVTFEYDEITGTYSMSSEAYDLN